jgi:hypothetical protein
MTNLRNNYSPDLSEEYSKWKSDSLDRVDADGNKLRNLGAFALSIGVWWRA